MIDKFFFFFLTLVITFHGCEKTVISYPGNNQSTTPSTPKGTIEWETNFESLEIVDADEKRVRIDEESTGTIGNLNAIDDNPDDDFCFKIKSQTNGNHFSLVGTNNEYCDEGYSGGDVKLELSTKPSFEDLSSGKTIEVDIEVMDDSYLKNNSTFKLFIGVKNINEQPYFNNVNQFSNRVAHEGIEFTYIFQPDDVDEDDTFSVSSDNKPTWLNIIGFEINGVPPQTDSDLDFSFSITVTDAGNDGSPLSATEAFNISVFNNQPPFFTNQNFNIVWEEELNTTYTISVNDQNVDLGLLSIELSPDAADYGIEFSQVNNSTWHLTGILANSYVDQVISFEVTLADNRNLSPETDDETLQITVDPNDAPIFTNASELPELIHHGCEYDFTLYITDDDPSVTIDIEENSDWLNVITNFNSVRFNGIPQESDIGSSESISVTVSDNRPNVTLTEIQSFSITIDRNFPPEFTNEDNVDTTGIVGLEYSNTFGVEDDNGDNFNFTVPVKPSWLEVFSDLYKISGIPTEEGSFPVTVQLDDGCEVTSFQYDIVVTQE